MTNTIKLRGWEFLPGQGFKLKYYNSLLEAGRAHTLTELMQYTGLKDKNGKEIYAGDIVKCHTGWESQPQSFTDIVRFEQGVFGVKLKQHGQQQLKLTGFETVEVNGNIYENLELLTIVLEENNND